jgi:hypothetical protein
MSVQGLKLQERAGVPRERSMRMRSVVSFPVCLALLSGVLSTADAAETIVGQWALALADCNGPAENRLTIRPLALEGLISCQFQSVERRSNHILWQGTCYGPEGDPRDGGLEAVLSGRTLMLNGAGLELGPLMRCP